MIQKFMKEEFNIEITMNRIAHYLLEWGGEYGRVREIAPVDPTWHARRIGRFIVQYHRALKEEAEGIAVIVYTDESYIHKENYHGNIDSKMWFAVLENRIIPAFKAKYPGKKMTLAMDNASYHMGRGDDWKSP